MSSATRIVVRALGIVAIDIGERRIGPSSGRLFALLLYLACRRGEATSRRVLQELLFPQSNDGQAAHSLRQLLYRLRQLGAPVEADADQLTIPVERLSVDWLDFLEAAEPSGLDIERLTHGVFPAYDPDVSDPFREWFEAYRADVSLQLSRALGVYLTRVRRDARWDSVDVASRALLSLDPLSEEGTLARAEVLALSGSKTAALRIIDDYLEEVGAAQSLLRLTPATVRRRISEGFSESGRANPEDHVFVGREETMRQLSALERSARSGGQHILLVWGEPGIGKTRLLNEYRALASLQGSIVQLYSCQPHDVFRPLGILCDLVAQLLDAPGALGCDPDARQLLERLVRGHSQIGSRREDAGSETSLPSIVRSLSELVSAIAAECSILILIDDAQWLDQGSMRAILRAFTGPAARRFCVTMASRERGLLAGADQHSDAISSVRLSPLDHAAALELARSLLKATADKGEGVVSQILDQAGGNPFFIRLLCSHFSATKDTESLKYTIAEVLERRLQQLSPDAMRVLEACVVLGKNCSLVRLEGLLEVPRHRLFQSIEELDDRALVQVIDGCFVSSHALLGEAVVKRISRSVWRALHASAAELLQRELALSQTGSLPWDCAEHWRQADNHLQAIAVLRNCARRALEIGRASDAVTTLKRALELNASDEMRLTIVEEALAAVEWGLNWTEAGELVAERKSLRTRLGRPQAKHDRFEMAEFAIILHTGGDPRVNVRGLWSYVTAVKADPNVRLNAGRQLLMIAEMTLDHGLAESAYQSMKEIAPDTTSQAFARLVYHTCFGNPQEATRLAADLAEKALDTPAILTYALNAAYAQYRVGSSEVAEETLLRCLDLARKGGSESGEKHACLFLARLCWSNSRYEESKAWYERFSCHPLRLGEQDLIWEHNVLGARLAIRDGRSNEAALHVQRARQSPSAKLELPRMLLLACEIELRDAAREELCTDAELEDLLALHQSGRQLGCHDEVMFALFTALRIRNREQQGIELLRTYVAHHRRDGFPLDSRLMRLVSQARSVQVARA